VVVESKNYTKKRGKEKVDGQNKKSTTKNRGSAERTVAPGTETNCVGKKKGGQEKSSWCDLFRMTGKKKKKREGGKGRLHRGGQGGE